MRIFKFGGASVKDASGVKNVVEVLRQVGYENTLIVVSAMGKTTNALEEVIRCYFHDKEQLSAAIEAVKQYHLQLVSELFTTVPDSLSNRLQELFNEMAYFLEHNKSPNYNFVYDQVVSCGELWSTVIVHAYFNEVGLQANLLDVRNLVKTDDSYRDAVVDWQQTEQNIQQAVQPKLLYVTQGFLGSDANGFTTTLGREGSDYTAAIFGYSLGAESVTIWKDVPGVLNADPRYFDETVLLQQISYREAIELAFYGASVIHPKTLQPLQSKEIPLLVKSFVNPLLPGTKVSRGAHLVPETPCFIVKKNQHLLSVSSKDFSFVMENNIRDIFDLLHQYKIKVNMIQNSAISFSVCVEDKFLRFHELTAQLQDKFVVHTQENVSLYTIRHFTQESIQSLEAKHEILLKQVMDQTIQVVAV
ncbi:MAG: aspartate kinase [Flavobacterium sp.]